MLHLIGCSPLAHSRSKHGSDNSAEKNYHCRNNGSTRKRNGGTRKSAIWWSGHAWLILHDCLGVPTFAAPLWARRLPPANGVAAVRRRCRPLEQPGLGVEVKSRLEIMDNNLDSMCLPEPAEECPRTGLPMTRNAPRPRDQDKLIYLTTSILRKEGLQNIALKLGVGIPEAQGNLDDGALVWKVKIRLQAILAADALLRVVILESIHCGIAKLPHVLIRQLIANARPASLKEARKLAGQPASQFEQYLNFAHRSLRRPTTE